MAHDFYRIRNVTRRPLRIAGSIISAATDGTVVDLNGPRVAQEMRTFQSFPFRGTRFIGLGTANDLAGTDAGAYTMAPNKANAELTISTGQILWTAIELGAGESLAGLTYYSGATALNTGTHQYVGLYKPNAAGTTLTQVAVSADGTSGAWAGSAAKAFTFTTAYKSAGGGTYYAALLVAATTPPTLVGRTPFNSVLANIDGTSTGLYELETSLTGSNNDIRLISVGSVSDITLTLTNAGGTTPLSVAVVSHAITATLATTTGTITTTAALLLAAINAAPTAAALVTASLKSGNDGTGVVTALASTPLTASGAKLFGTSGNAAIALPATQLLSGLTSTNLIPLVKLT